MVDIFLGLPQAFLISQYVQRQDSFSHVVRLVSTQMDSGPVLGSDPNDLTQITKNVYPLDKLEAVAKHYQRSILPTLLIIESQSLRSLLRYWGRLLQSLTHQDHLAIWLWVPNSTRVTETLTSRPDFMNSINNIYYADVSILLDVLTKGNEYLPSLSSMKIGDERNLGASSSSCGTCCSSGTRGTSGKDTNSPDPLPFYKLNLPEKRLKRIPPPTPVDKTQIKTYRTLMRI